MLIAFYKYSASNQFILHLAFSNQTKPNVVRKYAGPALDLDNFEVHQKIPLTAYGRPGFLAILYQLVW
jgi:hypothetical protein